MSGVMTTGFGWHPGQRIAGQKKKMTAAATITGTEPGMTSFGSRDGHDPFGEAAFVVPTACTEGYALYGDVGAQVVYVPTAGFLDP